MYRTLALTSLSLFGAARAQQVGTSTTETHPKMTWQTCTGTGGNSCTTKQGSIVLDANWRWSHVTSGYTNCYDGNSWNTTACPDGSTCTKNCAIDGADYSGTYGIKTSSNSLSLQFVTKGSYSANIGSRTYLMESDTKYQMFNLIGKEFTFDVDVSKLPCGLNGALYFVEMAADGGINKGNNKAGAKYGTGYCDSQCPHDIKFINGVANVEGWNPSDADPNAGSGKIGACCPEMDIWEANSISTAYTPHPCKGTGLQECTDAVSCGDGDNRYGGLCDKDGCDFNSYRMGVKDFYGPGMTLDTTKKMTVVTQFIGSGSSLSEIKRFYIQGGKVFKNSDSAIEGVSGNSITESFCEAQKTTFGDTNSFKTLGGLNGMGASLARGHVLVMSLWDDHAVNMLWLDSTYPTDASPDKLGAARGTCATDSGKPEDVEANSPGATVVFSNIKFGPIGSTFAQPA
ncbi:Esterase/lipase/thioesterase [Alternaria rosae]|uniref:exoglucanase-like protein 1 precursor n=1 Tax=Alternaria rosae TaxID=1187941 RepID=UPI001E8D676D|nr:exoglucanase-like protein 1 precursor [Alternaria rosae]KAH6881934.1 exoglucanase-like protein 1 precursor [Alternaria rosae]KAI4945029.1 Esterase/lipase/thioesterase [Alternaria rosae]